MRIPAKTLAVAAALGVVLTAAPTLHAHDSPGSEGSMMGSGMMGQGGMMGMMGQMGEMMEGCNKMTQSMHQGGSGQPNEQWRHDAPDREGPPATGG